MNRLVIGSAGRQFQRAVLQRPVGIAPTLFTPSAAAPIFNFAGPASFSRLNNQDLYFSNPSTIINQEESTSSAVVEVTSILRKRRTKMNKHKLQKRRKLDRRRHLR